MLVPGALDLPLLAQARLLQRLQLTLFDFGEGLDLPRKLRRPQLLPALLHEARFLLPSGERLLLRHISPIALRIPVPPQLAYDHRHAGHPPDLAAGVVYAILFIAILIALVLFTEAALDFVAARLDGGMPAVEMAAEQRERLAVLATLLGALIGAPLLVWKLSTAQHQANTAREAHYTTLIGEALEKLAATREIESVETEEGGRKTTWKRFDPIEELQRGGVEMLARVARDSQRDAWPIAGIIAAFLRKEIARAAMIGQQAEVDEELENERADSRRLVRSVFGRVCEITARADSGAEPLDLAGIDLGGHTFRSLVLTRLAMPDGNFNATTFVACGLNDCDLSQASLVDSRWRGEETARAPDTPSSVWRRVTATDADFSKATIVAGHWSYVIAADARFHRADLRRLTARDCSFIGVKLNSAQLQGASFGACDFAGADLTGAQVQGCDLRGALNLTGEMLAKAKGDEKTRLPPGLTAPAEWFAPPLDEAAMPEAAQEAVAAA
jgi:uncharacterized protein YjbI with pentapeptide repeats